MNPGPQHPPPLATCTHVDLHVRKLEESELLNPEHVPELLFQFPSYESQHPSPQEDPVD